MKRFLTLSILLLSFSVLGTFAQSSTQDNTRLDDQPKLNTQDYLNQKMFEYNKRNKAGGSTILNYGRTMSSIYQASVRIVDVPLFPDTILRNFGGTFANIYTHYVTNLLDPTSDQFATDNQLNFSNDIYFRDENSYVVDSVLVPIQYLRTINRKKIYYTVGLLDTVVNSDTTRNMADDQDSIRTTVTTRSSISNVLDSSVAIVDTILVEVFTENDAVFTTAFSTGNAAEYNVDTVRWKQIPYTPSTNRVAVSGKTQHKLVMDSIFFKDSLTAGTTYGQDGVYLFQFPVEVTVNAGSTVGAGYTFIPGFDHYNKKQVITLDTVANFTATQDTIKTWDLAADSIYLFDTIYDVTVGATISYTTKTDTVTKYNSAQFQSFEEQGADNSPLYFPGEWNNSYQVGPTRRYSAQETVFMANRYAFADGSQIENHDVFYFLSCATCFYTGVKTNSISGIEVGEAYPNPAKTGSFIELPVTVNGVEENVKVELINALGNIQRTIQANVKGQSVLTIQTKDIASGVYFVKVSKGDASVTKRMVIVD